MQSPSDDIGDKSKADNLAKSLVCIQVLWIIGQAIERRAANYPLTILEIHTIVHAICALFMYTLWWNKPFNEQAPTALELGKDKDLLGFLQETFPHPLLSRDFSKQLAISDKSHIKITHSHGFDGHLFINNMNIADKIMSGKEDWCLRPEFVWYGPGTLPQSQAQYGRDDTAIGIGMPDDSNQKFSQVYRSCATTHTSEEVHRFLIAPVHYQWKPSLNDSVCTIYSGQAFESNLGLSLAGNPAHLWHRMVTQAISLSQKDIRRLDMVSKFLSRINHKFGSYINLYRAEQYKSIETTRVIYSSSLALPLFDHKCGPNPLQHRAKNIDWVLNRYDVDNIFIFLAMVVIPAAYGCVHLGALAAIFPTEQEKLLWKVSCFYLIGCSAALLAVVLFNFIGDFVIGLWKRFFTPNRDSRAPRKAQDLDTFWGKVSFDFDLIALCLGLLGAGCAALVTWAHGST